MAGVIVGASHEAGQSVEEWAASTVTLLEEHPSGFIVAPGEHIATVGWAECRKMDADLKSRKMSVLGTIGTLPTNEMQEFTRKVPIVTLQAMLHADFCVDGFAARLAALHDAMSGKMHILDASGGTM